MQVRAGTGPVLVRCCQHRPSAGPVLAPTGTFTGNHPGGDCLEKSSLKICTWNIHGLDDFKLSRDILGKYLTTFDIIMLNETWSSGNADFNLDGYTFIDFHRKSKHPNALRYSGGIGIFVKLGLKKGIHVYKTHKDAIVWLKLVKHFFGLPNDFYLCSIYFPPENSTCIEDDLFTILQADILQIGTQSSILICGDANARTSNSSDIECIINGSDLDIVNDNLNYFSGISPSFTSYLEFNSIMQRRSMDTGNSNRYGTDLLNMCKASNMIIVNGRCGADKNIGHYTRIDTTGNSLVDYVLASINAFKHIKHFKVNPKFPESDHLPITFELMLGNLNQLNDKPPENKCVTSKWHKTYKYKLNIQENPNVQLKLCDDISKTFQSKVYESIVELNNPDVVAGHLHNYVKQACDRAFVKREIKVKNTSQNPPWFDQECRELRLKAIEVSKTSNVADNFNDIKNICADYKSLKQRKKRAFHHECTQKIENSYKHNPTNMWKMITSLCPKNITNNSPSGDEFYSYFLTKSTPEKNSDFDYAYEETASSFLTHLSKLKEPPISDLKGHILNCNFTEAEIESCIKLLKNNKCPGIDEIPAECIKNNSKYLVRDITVVFNYILESQDFPESWSEGIRNPIFKKGSKSLPENYRGITILPVFEKIFEISVQKRLEYVDSAFNMSDPHNAGFEKNSRTVDNIFFLQGLVEKQLTMGKNLIVVFVDFSQAFDRVNRNILFYKINKLGLKGRLINTLHSLYKKTCYRVKCGGKLSDKVDENIGVNQGGNASPLLFKKYIQDLILYLDEHTGVHLSKGVCLHRAWADDLFLVSTNTPDSQMQLNGLKRFCSPNQMIVNNIKTKAMVFGKHIKIDLTFGGLLIEQVHSYKSLGLMLNAITTPKGNLLKNHPDYLCEQARKAVFSIQSKLKHIGNIQPTHMFYIYESMIKPILTYGSELWGCNKQACKTVDNMFMWFLRKVLNVKRSTSNIITLGECGIFPPSIQSHISCVLYTIRLNSIEKESVLDNVAKDVIHYDSLGFNNWYSGACALAKSYNIDLDNITYSDEAKKYIKSTIRETFIKKWHSDLNNLVDNPILRTYSLFKFGFKMENHLSLIKNPAYRKAISKVRCSSHLLHIEKGRHTRPKTPIDQRLCHSCNVIEDEIHFITQCPLFQSERNALYEKVRFIDPHFVNLSHSDKFIYLFRSPDPIILSHLGKYIHVSFLKRDSNSHST